MSWAMVGSIFFNAGDGLKGKILMSKDGVCITMVNPGNIGDTHYTTPDAHMNNGGSRN